MTLHGISWGKLSSMTRVSTRPRTGPANRIVDVPLGPSVETGPTQRAKAPPAHNCVCIVRPSGYRWYQLMLVKRDPAIDGTTSIRLKLRRVPLPRPLVLTSVSDNVVHVSIQLAYSPVHLWVGACLTYYRCPFNRSAKLTRASGFPMFSLRAKSPVHYI